MGKSRDISKVLNNEGLVDSNDLATGAAAANLGSYVSSVASKTGAVTLTKTDVGLDNVANVDQTNATNLTSGTVPDARFPATLPAASGANLTNLNGSNISSGTVPAARLGSGTPGSGNFLRGDGSWQTVSTTPTTAQVLSATAGASAGEIGTYAWLGRNVSGSLSFGSTYAGSGLFAGGIGISDGADWGTSTVVGIVASGSGGNARSGTWRCMGNYWASPHAAATVFLRIS